MKFKFYEFFAGGGMARLGLGENWQCVFANDFDETKATAYREHFSSSEELHVSDIANILPLDLPGQVDLAWASFPCQDLSLAGMGRGLKGERSGTFWDFWKLMRGLGKSRRAPRMVVLENVYGAITSHKGKDFAIICEALAEEGFTYAPMVIDAEYFLPQSRPRLFIVAFNHETRPPGNFIMDRPGSPWHPDAFSLAYDRLSTEGRGKWLWVHLPMPVRRKLKLSDIVEEYPKDVAWHTGAETARLLAMMTPINKCKVKSTSKMARRVVGAIYRRTRLGQQRAEVRFDDIAGCLRTPAGGSSRQIILFVEGRRIRSRLLSAREAARLMGIPENYQLPRRYNDAYRLAGDGVAVPVVSWLAKCLIEPSLAGKVSEEAA
ncbi:MAG: DNA cytosine methyltransferase [Nitrospinae bacterium]|nr:DNA cytosine methyltransferase [Nitrospinota bacterium]